MIAGVALVLVLGIALDTRVVTIGSEEDVAEAGFSPATFGAETFPSRPWRGVWPRRARLLARLPL